MATNPMKPAIYFAAGTLEKQEAWRHYALNIPYYTHFTSPIRRYADVMVHRVLTAVLNDQVEELGLSIFDIEDILEHCNEKKSKSKEAQDRCDHTFFCLYLDGKDLISEACVVDWGEKSFELFIPEYGVTKRVHVDDLKCNIKTKEDGFVLSPLKTASPSREIQSADSSAKQSVRPANNEEANVKPLPQKAAQENELVPDSRLRVLEKNEKDKALENLDIDMRKLTVVQANLDIETDNNEALPKFKSGSDIPVFMLPNELTGVVEEVPAEILGRGTKAGVNVIYVRDLNGKKAEMMLPSMNNFVEATNSTKKPPRRNHNGKGGKGAKFSKKGAQNVKAGTKIKKSATQSNYGDETKGRGLRNGKMGAGVLTEPITVKMLKRMKVRLYMIKRVPVDFGVEILDIHDWDPIGYEK